MRLALWALAALAIGACANASSLDGVSPTAEAGSGDDSAAWRELATRARPLDDSGELLDRAVAATVPAERVAVLEAWQAAGGRLAEVPHARPLDDNDRTIEIGSLALEALAGAPDDRAIEAALYLAQRMRRDGISMLDAMLAVAIARKVVQLRPQPPAFAARYAPADDEVVRAFDAEALWVARAAAWALTDDAAHLSDASASYRDLAKLRGAEPLKQWSWLAAAPRDRAGFQSALAARAAAAPPGDAARELPAYAGKLFESVDAYRAWLKTSP